jgi:hypothetical protein
VAVDALAESRGLLDDVAPGDLDRIRAGLDAASAYDYDLPPPSADGGESGPANAVERPTDYSKR